MSAPCNECGMHLPDEPIYHPHLFCVIWKAYMEDPAKVLKAHGYVWTRLSEPAVVLVSYPDNKETH